MKTIKELEVFEIPGALHPRRRIVVLQRSDGNYSFAEEYFYDSYFEGDPVASGWARLPANGIYATAEIAEFEGRSAFARSHRLAGGSQSDSEI